MRPDTSINLYNIEELLEDLRAGHVVLTPNQRLARRLQLSWGHYQIAQGHTCWPAPAIMSLEHWWQKCYDAAVLAGENLPALFSAQQELELWQRAITDHEASAALLRPRAAAQLARDAYHNLMLWDVDWRTEPHASRFRFDPDGRLFAQWAEYFETNASTMQLASIPMLAPQLAAYGASEKIVLAEFNEVPPLFRTLLEQQAAVVELYRYRRAPGQHQLLSCASEAEELSRAVEWINEQKAGAPQCTIGLLVPGLEQRRETVLRQLRESLGPGLAFNVSAGISLASCAPVRTALALLSLPQEETTVAELGLLLHSRYRDDGELLQEQQLLQRLYRRGRPGVTAALLRHECAQIETVTPGGLGLGLQLQQIAQRRELKGRHLLREGASLFQDCLDTLGWPGRKPLDSIEFQQIEHWQRALAELAELDSVCPPSNFSEALQRLRQLCSDSVFQPQTDDASIQVLGLLEAAGLQFDRLWICGMSNAEWPPAATPNPFIPGHTQAHLQMPHANAMRELEYAQSLLRHYVESGADIVASYCAEADDIPLEPSPLLQGFEVISDADVQASWPAVWLEQQEQGALEQLQDAQAPTLSTEELSRLRGGSGLLADQSQCPFRGFAYHRLHARPLPDLAESLSAAERGSLLHEALYRLWGDIGDSDSLAALSAAEQAATAASAANAAAVTWRQRFPQARTQALIDLEVRRLEALLNDWLDLERQRPPFRVIAREESAELVVGGLPLRLRMDRVDRLASGKEFVIDYKSGLARLQSWLGPRPEQPQLPLYTLVQAQRDVELDAIGFAVVNNRDPGYTGLGDTEVAAGVKIDFERSVARAWEEAPADWEQLCRRWKHDLEQLASEFLQGEARVDPLDRRNSCTYCGLEALCRVR